ncbi:hypothetical protein JCM12856_28420 [Spirochaeta dissipatitropha]
MGIIVVSVFAMIIVQANIHVDHYIDLRRNEIMRIVEVGVHSLDPVLKQYRRGDISFARAREDVLFSILDLRFTEQDGESYFFIGTYELSPIVLPSAMTDREYHRIPHSFAHGIDIMHQLIEVARSEETSGFLAYEVVEQEKVHSRIAYVQGIPELQLYIGVSLLTTDIHQAISEVIFRSVFFGSIIVLIMLAALYAALKPFTVISNELTGIFLQITRDPLGTLEFKDFRQLRWHEGQVIIQGLERMLNSLRTARFRQEVSEDRFRRLFSDSRDAILLTSGMQLLECNPQAVEFFSSSRDLLIGRDIQELLLHTASLPPSELKSLFERAVDGETVSLTLDLNRNNSAIESRSVDMSIHPQYLDMEFGFQIVMHDITSIRETEKMLQNLNENLYRTLYSIGDGIIVTDSEGRITRMNRVAESLVEWTQDEAIGRNLREIARLQDINSGAVVSWSLENVLFNSEENTTEIRELITRFGTRRSVSENGAPIRSGDNVIGGVLVFRDVSAQLLMQKELRENQRILSLVLDYTPVGVGAFTRRGDFIYANPRLCELLGYSALELRRMNFRAIISPDEMHSYARNFRRLILGSERESFEIRYKKRNGEERFAVLRGGGVQSEGDQRKPDFLVVIIQDVTEMKRVQQESSKKEQLLIQAEKLAALGELSAGMAHEINQPLTGISMAADNLQFLSSGQIPGKNISSEYVIEKTGHIHDYIDRIRSIIDHVRTFSREQLQEQQLKFQCSEALGNALSLVQSQYRGHGIELEIELLDEFCVRGNLYRLEQAVLNLLTNAKDAVLEMKNHNHHNSSEYRPHITLRMQAASADSLNIIISDNGTGIPAELLQQVFNPFYTTKPVDKGTGLGLSVTYGIIQEMGGEIEIQSDEGHGTMVLIRLPIAGDGEC